MKTHSDLLVVPTGAPVIGLSVGYVMDVPSGRLLPLFHPLVRTSSVFPSGLIAVLTASAASALPSSRNPVERTSMVDPGAAIGVKTCPVGRIDAVPKFPTGCVVWPLPNCAEARLGVKTNSIAFKRSRPFAKVPSKVPERLASIKPRFHKSLASDVKRG